MGDRLLSPEFAYELVAGALSLAGFGWGLIRYMISQIEESELRSKKDANDQIAACEARANRRIDECRGIEERDAKNTIIELDALRRQVQAAAVDNMDRYASKKDVEGLENRMSATLSRVESKIDQLLFERRGGSPPS